jgi:hypothetical protein
MNTDEREQALLRLVQEERDKACRGLLAEAEARARAIKRDAYRRERAALHERIAAERQRAEGLLRAAAAERATAERRLGEQADARLIAAAWPVLREQLAERWADAGSRGQWVSAALAQARRRLPHTTWTIRHAAGWPRVERDTALAGLAADGIPTPALRADGGLGAGLVIAAGGAVLDMSLEGLLRDRARVEARLLALAKREDTAPPPQPAVTDAPAAEEGTA